MVLKEGSCWILLTTGTIKVRFHFTIYNLSSALISDDIQHEVQWLTTLELCCFVIMKMSFWNIWIASFILSMYINKCMINIFFPFLINCIWEFKLDKEFKTQRVFKEIKQDNFYSTPLWASLKLQNKGTKLWKMNSLKKI